LPAFFICAFAPMYIPLDRQATQPIYLQIRDRVHRLITSGALQPGDRLPSVRELAKEAQVNKLTVIEARPVKFGSATVPTVFTRE